MNILRTVSKLVLAFVRTIQGLVMRVMGWTFHYFTSEDFLPKMGTLGDGTGKFYKLFYSSSDNANVFNLLLSKVIVPTCIAIVIILFSFSMFKSMISQKETESPLKTVVRSAISLVLMLISLSVCTILLDAGNYAQVWVGEVINETTGGVTDESFRNLEAKAEEMLGNSSTYTAEEVEYAQANQNTWENGYQMYIHAGGSGSIESWLATSDSTGSNTGTIWQYHDLNNDGILNEADYDMALAILHTSSSEELSSNVYQIGICILSSILGLVLTWKFLKMIYMYLNRYVRIAMMIIFSPLSCAAYASETSEEIFFSYLRMYVSSLISLVITQALVLGMQFACSVTLNASSLALMILYYCLTLSYVSFTASIDTYLNKVKLNVGAQQREPAFGNLGMMAGRMLGESVIGGMLSGMGSVIGGVTSAALHPREAMGTISNTVAGTGTSGGITHSTEKTTGLTNGIGTEVKDGAVVNGVAGTSASTTATSVNSKTAAMTGMGVALTNIPASQKNAVKVAASTALGMAQATVTGYTGNQAMRKATRDANGKYAVESVVGTAGSVLEAIKGQEGIVSATINGQNGAVYNVEKHQSYLGNNTFKIQDISHGLSLGNDSINTWEQALVKVDEAANGITGESEFASGKGELFRTHDGTSEVMKQEGVYESWDNALNRMGFFDSYDVTNNAGYQEKVTSMNKVTNTLERAESVDVKGERTDGGVIHATLDSRGSVFVADKKGKEKKYSGIDAFRQGEGIEKFSFSTDQRNETRDKRAKKIFH